MFEQTDMMRIVEKYRGDAIVVAAYRSDPAWAKVTTNPHRDLPFWSAMGKGSSMALGLALASCSPPDGDPEDGLPGPAAVTAPAATPALSPEVGAPPQSGPGQVERAGDAPRAGAPTPTPAETRSAGRATTPEDVATPPQPASTPVTGSGVVASRAGQVRP